MQQYSHKCIKCQESYTDEDPDPYYCEVCNEARKQIAKEVDSKIAMTPKAPVTSALKEYDAAPKIRGFVQAHLN